MLASALVGAAFTVGDGAGWIEFLTSYKPTQQQVVAGVFVIFAIIALVRLVRLQSKIEGLESQLKNPQLFEIEWLTHPMALFVAKKRTGIGHVAKVVSGQLQSL